MKATANDALSALRSAVGGLKDTASPSDVAGPSSSATTSGPLKPGQFNASRRNSSEAIPGTVSTIGFSSPSRPLNFTSAVLF